MHVKIVTPHDMNDSWWVRCYVDGQELDSHALTGRKYPATAVFKEFHTEEDDRIVAKALKFGPVVPPPSTFQTQLTRRSQR